VKGENDDRPIQEQAAGMLDQLALMEEMMNTQTFGDGLITIETTPEEGAPEPDDPDAPPHYPSFQLD
jgi:hypothetical protein